MIPIDSLGNNTFYSTFLLCLNLQINLKWYKRGAFKRVDHFAENGEVATTLAP